MSYGVIGCLHIPYPSHAAPSPLSTLYVRALTPIAIPPDSNDADTACQLTFQQAVDDRVKINFCG